MINFGDLHWYPNNINYFEGGRVAITSRIIFPTQADLASMKVEPTQAVDPGKHAALVETSTVSWSRRWNYHDLLAVMIELHTLG